MDVNANPHRNTYGGTYTLVCCSYSGRCVLVAGVIRVWDLLNGRQTHSLDPLPSSQTTSSQPQSDVGQGEDEEDDALTPQVYTDLLWCGPRQELVGITYDHSIIFYDIATFHRQKQVCMTVCVKHSDGLL